MADKTRCNRTRSMLDDAPAYTTPGSASIMMRQLLSTPDQYRALVDQFDTFLLDMDGVLWQGSKLVAGVDRALARLRALGKRLIFVTNNSTKSRASYVHKLESLGLYGATPDDIVGAAYATACYLTSIGFPNDKWVYVVGQQGVIDELAAQGFQACGLEDTSVPFTGMDDLAAIQPDPRIGAVVCGFDGHLNYIKLAKAHTYLTCNPDTLFLATNPDVCDPVGGRTFPACGAMYSPLVASTGRAPRVIGKPNATMLDVIVRVHGLDPARTCMVGDRLDTDVRFGLNGGCQTLLVLSGVTTEEALLSQTEIMPHYYMTSLGELQHIP
ncbi:hypothetical protein GGF32_002317 [Allomyces javanicus]|nr:hypothetical protein GGF32_002317 [Allomyces javanicus]